MKAKERIKELLETRLPDRDSDDYIEKMDMLKPTINSLLMEYLPDNLTIKEADVLAMVIFEIIVNPDNFL